MFNLLFREKHFNGSACRMKSSAPRPVVVIDGLPQELRPSILNPRSCFYVPVLAFWDSFSLDVYSSSYFSLLSSLLLSSSLSLSLSDAFSSFFSAATVLGDVVLGVRLRTPALGFHLLWSMLKVSRLEE